MNSDSFASAEITRRRFLGRSAAGVAGLVAVPNVDAARASASPADRVRVGIIGVRSRGLELARGFAARPDAEVASLCDVDGLVRRTALRELAAVQPRVPRVVKDHRILLEDDSLDAVVIATPDHWHAAMTAEALRAGKDVYLEVPVTHTIEEAEELQRIAAASGGRVIQCGLQQRSCEHFRTAIEFVRSGGVGRVGFVRAWASHRRNSLAKTSSDAGGMSQPHDVDYQRWLGPAARRAFDPLCFHHHWRWRWDFGSGELGNWGVHLLDVARWGLGVDLPRRVVASGRQLRPDMGLETPDTLHVHYEYPDAMILWEHRLWSDYGMEGRSAGVAFCGDEGNLVVDRGGWKVYGRKDGPSSPATPSLEPHLANFLDCVRTRRQPAADLGAASISSALCHLGNLAYRNGDALRLA
jgi:predicted dehydrogenase